MKKILLLWLSMIVWITGCTTNDATSQMMTLQVGVMPAVDSAPLYHAKDAGYFDEVNLAVDIVQFTNAQDRQSALQTGSVDGAITDLIALVTNRASGFDLKATTLTDGMFVMLAQKNAFDKASLKVGVMEVSVANFLTDYWLADSYQLDKVYINAIPARLEAVATNQLDMGFFPEPLGAVGESKGLEKLIYQPLDNITPDVMAFTGKAIAEKSAALQAFHHAYNRAVRDIQGDHTIARDSLLKYIPNIDEALSDQITLPDYHEAQLPSEDYLQQIIDWTSQMTTLPREIVPAELIDAQFIE